MAESRKPQRSANLERGIALRKKLFGGRYVDEFLASRNVLDREVQTLVTEFGYGMVWSRRGLTPATRSMLTLALLAAANRPDQLRPHITGARNLGVTRREMIEVFIHVMLYCGAPAGLSAVKIAMEAFQSWDDRAKSPKQAARRRGQTPKKAQATRRSG
jgi:4-carboxymuconolactone decarboxylase